MRPPAPHIKFKVAMWVPLKDLTDSEREEYEKRKQQDQNAMYHTVSTELLSSQKVGSTVMDKGEERVDPNSVAAEIGLRTSAPDTPVAIPAQQETPAPMAISPQPESVSNKRKLGEEDYSTPSFSATPGNPSDEAKRRKLNEATLSKEEKSKVVQFEDTGTNPAVNLPAIDLDKTQNFDSTKAIHFEAGDVGDVSEDIGGATNT